MTFGKPFNQNHVIQSLQKENDYLRAQANALNQTTKLIEAAITGLSTQTTLDAQTIAKKAIEIAGAVIMEIQSLQNDQTDPNAQKQ